MHAAKRYTVTSATIRGAEAIPVSVEVIVSSGLPGFHIVGMPDTVIHEARERIRAAVKSCGLNIPGDKIVFNLAPGELKKTGSGFDLPMAVALLAATGQIPTQAIQDKMIIGELSLDGSVRAVQGMIAFQMCANKNGFDLLCANQDFSFSSLFCDLNIYTCNSLRSFLEQDFTRLTPKSIELNENTLDYSDVGGHKVAKRALQIAAAGNHGLLMIGPPGSGKSMLAKRLPTILPPLSEKEAATSAAIASIAGEDVDNILKGVRPFRAPHHSATLAGLIGGGNPVRPGEVSLAHNGVLMLDEIAEFSSKVLQGLRQPMEDKHVCITRADGNIVMPSNFMLVASTNPCPCGYFGDPEISCTCALPKVRSYQNRIGGPLIDRIDMFIDVWRSEFSDVVKGDTHYSSQYLRKGVFAGREFALQRLKNSDSSPTSKNSVSALMQECAMSTGTYKYFRECAQRYHLSGRGIMRVLGVARTIADIEQKKSVGEEHLAEALTLRVRNFNAEGTLN